MMMPDRSDLESEELIVLLFVSVCQFDPFGQSSTQGSLLRAEVAFDDISFTQIDYEEILQTPIKKNL